MASGGCSIGVGGAQMPFPVGGGGLGVPPTSALPFSDPTPKPLPTGGIVPENIFADVSGRVLREAQEPLVLIISCSCRAADASQPRQTLCSEMLHWDAVQEERRQQGLPPFPTPNASTVPSMESLMSPRNSPIEVMSTFTDGGELLASKLVSVNSSLLFNRGAKGSLSQTSVKPFCTEMVHWDDICDAAIKDSNTNQSVRCNGSFEGLNMNPILQSSAVLEGASKCRMKELFLPHPPFSVDVLKIHKEGVNLLSFMTSMPALKHMKGDDTGRARFCTEMLHFDQVLGPERKREGQPLMETLFGIPGVTA